MNIFLKNRNYKYFSIATFLSSAGDVLFYLAFMTYASKLHNYSLALSLIAISESLPKLFDILGGYFADKTKNKFKIIVLLAIIRFLLYILVGLLLINNLKQWNVVIIIIIINFVSDTIGAYSFGLTTPIIVDLVGESNFGVANGFTNGINQIISMIFQFIGASLLLFITYSNLAFINALTFLLAGIIYACVGAKIKTKFSQKSLDFNDQNFIHTLKTSYNQTRNQFGLLTIVFIIAILNGSLSAIGALLPIMIAAKSTMILFNYSFTIAAMGTIVSCGAILGSIFGQQLSKKISVFSLIIIAIIFSLLTTITILFTNIYIVFVLYFLLAFTVSSASVKMSQWVVSSVEHKILSSTIGLLNTIITISAPLITTIFTTVSGIISIQISLIALAILEAITLAIAVYLKTVIPTIQTPLKEN